MALLEIRGDCAWEKEVGPRVDSRDPTASGEKVARMSMLGSQSRWKGLNLDGAQAPACEQKTTADALIPSGSSKRLEMAASDQDDEQDIGNDNSLPCTSSLISSVDNSEREHQKPDPLSFLENDSPSVTEERILQAIAEASENWSPRSISSFGSIDSSQRSSAETDATTPDQSVSGGSPPATALPRPSQLSEDPAVVAGASRPRRGSRTRRPQLHPHLDEVKDRYGTPEMARGPAKHPHFPPNELQPRIVAPGQGYPKYLPRAEKLPMTGYELLSAKLSTSDPWPRRRGSSGSSQSDDGLTIKPIYRRFEALNHRLLLHLQDELNELEEQLHRLDTADTQTRRLQNCILPASRRAESMAGGELQWRKTDTLGKIGFKLGQYSKYLSSLPNVLNARVPNGRCRPRPRIIHQDHGSPVSFHARHRRLPHLPSDTQPHRRD